MKSLSIPHKILSATKGVKHRATQLGASVATAAYLLAAQPVEAADAPAPVDTATLVSSTAMTQREDFSFPIKIGDTTIPAGESIPLIPYTINQSGYTTADIGDLLATIQVVDAGDKEKLVNAKRAILIDLISQAASSFPDAEGGKNVYMYCSAECADTIAELLKDTKIEGLNIRPYGAKYSPVLNNEYAALGMNTLVISGEDLWTHDALSDYKEAGRKIGYEAGKRDGIAERDVQVEGKIAEIEGEVSLQQKIGIATGVAGLAGTALGIGGIALVNRRRNRDVAFWKVRSKAKGFDMEIDEYFRKNNIFFDRDLGSGVRRVVIAGNLYDLRSDYSLEEGGTVVLMNSKGEYLTKYGNMSVIRGGGGNQPKVSLETLTAFLEAQLRESRTVQEVEREQERFVTELETFLRDGGIDFRLNGNGTYSFQDGSQRSYILIISTDGNRKVSFYDSTDGLHLDPSGNMVHLAEGKTIAGASFEVLKGYFQDHIFPGLSKVKDVGNHTSSLTDRTLVNLEVADVATISDSLFSTLNKIDLIIQNQGFVGKLDFRTVKGSNNARMSRFKYGEKDCEIYVDDAGRVQVIVGNVSTPEGNETSPFDEVRSVIESIFSDD